MILMTAAGEYDTMVKSEAAEKFVENAYRQLLHRAPDRAGLAAYTAILTNNDESAALDVISALINSQEFKTKWQYVRQESVGKYTFAADPLIQKFLTDDVMRNTQHL